MFQNVALMSFAVPVPDSPMALFRAFGEISRNGTAEPPPVVWADNPIGPSSSSESAGSNRRETDVHILEILIEFGVQFTFNLGNANAFAP